MVAGLGEILYPAKSFSYTVYAPPLVSHLLLLSMPAYKNLISHSHMQLALFPFFLSAQFKVYIRKLLPSGLADEHCIACNTVAYYAVAAIAHWDWPRTGLIYLTS